MVILERESIQRIDSFHMLLLLLFEFATQHIFVVPVAVSIPMSLISSGSWLSLAPCAIDVWNLAIRSCSKASRACVRSKLGPL